MVRENVVRSRIAELQEAKPIMRASLVIVQVLEPAERTLDVARPFFEPVPLCDFKILKPIPREIRAEE
jgi:hypothetical protein